MKSIKWRPEGWEKIKKNISNDVWMLPPQAEFPMLIPSSLDFDIMKHNLIDAGADAILEALREKGRFYEVVPLWPGEVAFKGKVVIIPDDKVTE